MTIEFGEAVVRRIDKGVIGPVADRRVKNFKEQAKSETSLEGVSITPVKNLIEVLNYPPFLNKNIPLEGKPTSICDINGVLTCTLDNIFINNFRSLLGLRDLARQSRKIIFSSSSMNLGDENSPLWHAVKPIFDGALPKWPFITDQAIDRLALFVNKANPECKTDFAIGIKEKLFKSGDNVTQSAISVLKDNEKLVIIGSSFTDRKILKRIAKAAEGQKINVRDSLYYFDTKHLVL